MLKTAKEHIELDGISEELAALTKIHPKDDGEHYY
jgi:hypothetical protein